MKITYEYNWFFNRGDHDNNHLPGAFDLVEGMESRDEAEQDLRVHVNNLNIRNGTGFASREQYTIVKRTVSDWEVAE